MTRSKIITLFVVTALVLAALYFVYLFFSGGGKTAETPGLTTSAGAPVALGGAAATGPEERERQDFAELLSSFGKLKFSTGLFANGLFVSLKDFSQPLPERAVGRANPFAPFGLGEAVAASPLPPAGNRRR